MITTRWMAKNRLCSTFLKCSDAETAGRSDKYRTRMAILTPDPRTLPICLWYTCVGSTDQLTRTQSMTALQNFVQPLCQTKYADLLVQPITTEGILNALLTGDRQKAPGIDGLWLEFYTANWETICPDLLQLLNHMFFHKNIFPLQKHRVIICLPKSNGVHAPDGYHPIFHPKHRMQNSGSDISPPPSTHSRRSTPEHSILWSPWKLSPGHHIQCSGLSRSLREHRYPFTHSISGLPKRI